MRIGYVGAIYHAVARGNNRQAVFREPQDYDHFLRLLLSLKATIPFRLYGYCLMTNHVHLLLQPDEEASLSALLQRLLGTYARHHNQRYGCEGHLWKNRFRSRVVTNDAYALRVLAYIDLNPVRAHLCQAAHEYVWSSARAHLLGSADPCLDLYLPLVVAKKHQTYRELLECCGGQRLPELEVYRPRGRPTKKSSDDFSARPKESYPQNRQTIFEGGGGDDG